MPRLSLAKLERHLYSAADRLRQEGLDAATYKDYIFGMLFLKRCSDVFDTENETPALPRLSVLGHQRPFRIGIRDSIRSRIEVDASGGSTKSPKRVSLVSGRPMDLLCSVDSKRSTGSGRPRRAKNGNGA